MHFPPTPPPPPVLTALTPPPHGGSPQPGVSRRPLPKDTLTQVPVQSEAGKLVTAQMLRGMGLNFISNFAFAKICLGQKCRHISFYVC